MLHSKRVNITLPADFLHELDQVAKSYFVTRSELVRRAVQLYMEAVSEQVSAGELFFKLQQQRIEQYQRRTGQQLL